MEKMLEEPSWEYFFGAMSFKQYHNMFGCNTGTIKEFPDNTDLVSS